MDIDYVNGHPFDLNLTSDFKVYRLGNTRKSQAEELNLKKGETIRTKLKLCTPERGSTKAFHVIVDGVELFRPLKFKNLPKTLDTVPYSLLFVGQASPDLSSYPPEVRGGDLEFEAYLFWNHVVVPKEHAGILIRINDSNGVLFDSSFMHYPVSEQRRKDQVTAEIFVKKGLDAALNIDRESFNYAHPHYQYITHWVHQAFRQLSNRHKAIGKAMRDSARENNAHQKMQAIDQKVNKTLRSLIPDEDTPLPEVIFTENEKQELQSRKEGYLAFQKSNVFGTRDQKRRSSSKQIIDDADFEARIKAVAKVLDAYGVFNKMSYEKQQRLLREIVAIFRDY